MGLDNIHNFHNSFNGMETPAVNAMVVETLEFAYPGATIEKNHDRELDKLGIDFMAKWKNKATKNIDIKGRWSKYPPNMPGVYDIHLELYSSYPLKKGIKEKFHGQLKAYIISEAVGLRDRAMFLELDKKPDPNEEPDPNDTPGTHGWVVDKNKETDDVVYFVIDPNAIDQAMVFTFDYKKIRDSLRNNYDFWIKKIREGVVDFPLVTPNYSPTNDLYFSVGFAPISSIIGEIDPDMDSFSPKGNYRPLTADNPGGIDYNSIIKQKYTEK